MIGKEVGFGTDNFGKPKILSIQDSIAQIILNILLMRPGNIPSLPHVGINIKKYLYALEEDIDVLELKNEIYNQCTELLPVLISDDIRFYINRMDGKDVLILFLPVYIDSSSNSNNDEGIMFAFTKEGAEGITYAYKYQKSK